jgi:hypothetical protein
MSKVSDFLGHPSQFGDHKGLAIDQAPLPEATELMISGIADVQAAYGHAMGANGLPTDINLLSRGLNNLTKMNRLLFTDAVLRDPLGISLTVPYPRKPIVETALASVAVSPLPSRQSRLLMADQWVNAASTGEGRTYPLRFIGKSAAGAVVQEVADEMMDFGQIDRFARDLDHRYGANRRFALLVGGTVAGTIAGIKYVSRHQR